MGHERSFADIAEKVRLVADSGHKIRRFGKADIRLLLMPWEQPESARLQNGEN